MNRLPNILRTLALAIVVLVANSAHGEELTAEQRTDLSQAFAKSRGQQLRELTMFAPSAAELEQAMQGDGKSVKEPLQFVKGKGVRLLMSGHSWVAPAVRTLPTIVRGAGIDDHHQRAHISSGHSGSANSIWLAEFGKFPGKPATPVLLPAVATGQWDIMSWGSFYGDTPECFSQWIDVCLKRNPEMTFLIQNGWPVHPSPAKFTTPAAILADMEAQHALGQKLTADMYEKLNRQYPGKVHLVPAGEAVMQALRHYFAGELPGFDCVSEHLGGKCGIYRDGGHLSIVGGEPLLGYVYFSVLYRRSPEAATDYHPAGLDPAADVLLRQAAWNAVINCPMSGVTGSSPK